MATVSCLLMPQSIDLAHATGSHVARPARCGGPQGQSIAFDASNLQTEPQYWDPNGDSLAGIAAGQVWGFWLLDRSGSVHRLIAQRYAYVADVDFSPDGRSLAFSASAGDKTTLYIADRDGSHIRAVAPLSVDSSIAWSPDSQSLAYTAPHGTGYALWVADSLGARHRRLLDLNAGDESGEITPASPSWLADGRAIVISTFTGLHFDVVRISPDGRSRATITPAAPPFDLLYDVACQPQ